MKTQLRRQMTDGVIRRTATLDRIEVRAADEGSTTVPFGGHAAVFGQRTWIGPPTFGFYEEVASGAFARTIKADEPDAALLFDHLSETVMARQSAGDLRLSEDADGLLVDADLDPEDADVQRLVPKLRNGHVRQMSFGFEVLDQDWQEIEVNDEVRADLRIINEVRLWEVSAVTFPAYPQTDAGLRSVAFDVLATRLGLSTTKRNRLLASLASDNPDPAVVPLLRDVNDHLASLVAELGPEPPSTRDDDESRSESPSTGAPQLAVLRRRHALNAARYDLSA